MYSTVELRVQATSDERLRLAFSFFPAPLRPFLGRLGRSCLALGRLVVVGRRVLEHPPPWNRIKRDLFQDFAWQFL